MMCGIQYKMQSKRNGGCQFPIKGSLWMHQQLHQKQHHPQQQTSSKTTTQPQYNTTSIWFHLFCFFSFLFSKLSISLFHPSVLACLLASLLPPFLSSFLPSVHLFICLFLPKQTPSLIQPTHPSHIPPHHPPQPLFISRINLDFHFLFFISFFSFLIFFFSHPLAGDYPHHLFFLFLFLLHILTALAHYLPTSVARTSLSHLPSRSLQTHTTHTYIYITNMTPKISSIIVTCKSQEELDEILASTRKVIVLYYSYAMP